MKQDGMSRELALALSDVLGLNEVKKWLSYYEQGIGSSTADGQKVLQAVETLKKAIDNGVLSGEKK